MKTRYIIIKKSRVYFGGRGYAGITCDKANVPKGKIYWNKKEAEEDAKKLTKHNLVGFQVLPYFENWQFYS